MYRLLDDRNKCVVMAILECGYTQEEVARMFGISQEAVSARFNKSKKLLQLHKEELLL